MEEPVMVIRHPSEASDVVGVDTAAGNVGSQGGDTVSLMT
jgi:hypothetical protein